VVGEELLDALRGERLEVDIVRRDRIGDDGGGVAVDQRDLDAFVAEEREAWLPA